MKTDVTEVTMRRNNDGAIVNIYKGESYKTFYLLRQEVDFIIDCEREVPATFRDISYFYSFYDDSVVHVYASMNDRADHTFFTLPLRQAIVPGLKAIRRGAMNWTCPPEQMQILKNRYWGRYHVHWQEHDDDDKDTLKRAIPHMDKLYQHLRGIFLIAANHSNGDHTHVFIQLDGWQPNDPPSFYWYIMKEIDGRYVRVINGGIIWHGNEYSVHT